MTAPPIARPLQSLIARAQRHAPEVPAFSCIDPVETAADKLSALTWRVLRRQRGRVGDDATLIRHLYDLAVLARTVKAAPAFAALALQAAATDVGRGGEATAASDPVTLFATMIERLRSDRLWAVEYDNFVRQVSFAQPHERISFEQALAGRDHTGGQSGCWVTRSYTARIKAFDPSLAGSCPKEGRGDLRRVAQSHIFNRQWLRAIGFRVVRRGCVVDKPSLSRLTCSTRFSLSTCDRCTRTPRTRASHNGT